MLPITEAWMSPVDDKIIYNQKKQISVSFAEHHSNQN